MYLMAVEFLSSQSSEGTCRIVFHIVRSVLLPPGAAVCVLFNVMSYNLRFPTELYCNLI